MIIKYKEKWIDVNSLKINIETIKITKSKAFAWIETPAGKSFCITLSKQSAKNLLKA